MRMLSPVGRWGFASFRRRVRGMIHASAAIGALLLGNFALAQTVQPREVSAEGVVYSNLGVWDSAITAPLNPGPGLNDSEIVSVYVGPKLHTVGFGRARKNQGGAWEWTLEGTIKEPQGSQLQGDPTIVYNRITGDYVVGGIVTPPGGDVPPEGTCSVVPSRPAWARYFPARAPFSQPWEYLDHPSLGDVYEPYMVGGRMDAQQQVFYLLASKVTGDCVGEPHCLRSGDAGDTFTYTGPLAAGLSAFVIPSTTPAAPDRVWVGTWGHDTSEFRFYEGTDNGGAMSWAPLLEQQTPVQVPLAVSVLTPYLFDKELPDRKYLPLPIAGGGATFQSRRIRMFPNIVADPQDPNIIHLAYHDVVSTTPINGDVDVDVFYRKLTRNPATNLWTVTPRQRVNAANPDPEKPIDDFLPSMVVTVRSDGTRVIHIAYYRDERWENQQDSDPFAPVPIYNQNAKFDANYAHSFNGVDWFNQRLFKDPNPALDPTGVDFGLIGPAGWSDFRLRDRLGICVHDADPNTPGFTIEIAWMGTNPDEVPYDSHPSCVWWSQVIWSQ